MSLPTNNRKPLRTLLATTATTATESLGVVGDLVSVAKAMTNTLKIETELESIDDLAQLMGWSPETVVEHKQAVSDKYFPKLIK